MLGNPIIINKWDKLYIYISLRAPAPAHPRVTRTRTCESIFLESCPICPSGEMSWNIKHLGVTNGGTNAGQIARDRGAFCHIADFVMFFQAVIVSRRPWVCDNWRSAPGAARGLRPCGSRAAGRIARRRARCNPGLRGLQPVERSALVLALPPRRNGLP